MEEEGLRRKGGPGGCRWEEGRGSMGEVDGRREEGGSGGRERTEEGRGKRLMKLRPLFNQCLLHY